VDPEQSSVSSRYKERPGRIDARVREFHHKAARRIATRNQHSEALLMRSEAMIVNEFKSLRPDTPDAEIYISSLL